MNKFKSLIMSCQGKSKTFLHWLYNTHYTTYSEDEEVENVNVNFKMHFLNFGFLLRLR